MNFVMMRVPEWFLKVGSKADRQVAADWGVPTAWVGFVRRSLGIPPYQQIKKKTSTLNKAARAKKYNLLRRHKIPRTAWPDALGFTPRAGLTAKECMEEWLYCYHKGLNYNPHFPKKRQLKIKVYKAKAQNRLSPNPRGPASSNLDELDDETFDVGDS